MKEQLSSEQKLEMIKKSLSGMEMKGVAMDTAEAAAG